MVDATHLKQAAVHAKEARRLLRLFLSQWSDDISIGREHVLTNTLLQLVEAAMEMDGKARDFDKEKHG